MFSFLGFNHDFIIYLDVTYIASNTETDDVTN